MSYLRITSISLFLLSHFSGFADDIKKNSDLEYDWYEPYTRYITWEDPLHPSRIIPVPESKLKDTIKRLKSESFISINQEEARWFLNDDSFNASSILAKVISIYSNEAQSEAKTALMLRASNNSTGAFMAEHKALKYNRKVESIKKYMFRAKLFLMRAMVPNRRHLSKGRFELYHNVDVQAMLMNFSVDKLEGHEMEPQPVIVILKEAYPKLYVSVSEKSED